MNWKILILMVIGSTAGFTSYTAYQNSGVLAAVVVFFTTSWLLHRFSSFERAWNTLGLFLNPVMTLIIFALAGFSYFAMAGEFFLASMTYAVGLAFLGAAFGMLVFKYWNIGS
ncbi:MAG: hypothetical protein ABEI58_02355 [Candidatus Nanohaloarchaea archaeon]